MPPLTGEENLQEAEEVGRFGRMYRQFKGKAKEAIDFLRQKRSGEAIGALHHPDIGDISLVWGDEKQGLQKIAEKHPEVLDDLQGIIDGMSIVQQSDNRIVLESGTHKAVVSKMKGDTPVPNWLLTAYEKKKPVSVSSSDIETEPEGMQNGTATLQNELYADKGSVSSTTEQEQTTKNSVPTDEKGELMYEAVDASTAWDALLEQTEGDADMAQSVADDMVSDKEAELKKLEKSKPKGGKTPKEKIQAEKKRKADIEAARQSLEKWKAIASEQAQRAKAEQQRRMDEQQSALEAQRRAEAEQRAEAERRQAEQQRAEAEAVKNVPDMVDDTPQDARARGYRRVSGRMAERQQSAGGLRGKDVDVKFADDVMQKGQVAVIEASELQPSHIDGERNPLHFIDEAQPKERNDQASIGAAEKIAGNIRPEEITSSVTAYSGAPTVNSRGEVIQGNNRSAALREMWRGHKAQAQKYKQYLIDHASDFGLNPEDIESMENPVLVNMADVDDNRAIELGQYSAQDTESGGVERIKPKNTAQRMGKDMRTFAGMLLQSSDEESSFASLLDANGVDVLKWMNRKGYITATQYQSAFDSRGNLTAEAKNDLKGIMYQSIFQGGGTRLEEMFNELPAKAQKAVLATAYRDFDSPSGERMIEELQDSIRAYYALAQYERFAEAKNYKEARIAADDWARQYQFDDATGESFLPSEKFSNFALLLAVTYKGQTQTYMQGMFNQIYDLIQGTQEADLFNEPDNRQRTLAEAIKEVLNIDYNGRIRNNVLAGNNQASQQGGQRSSGIAPTGERAKDGERRADSAGRTHSNSQGNPIDENGDLLVEEVSSVNEITDEDFTKPTRTVQLPVIPKKIDSAIGANGKPVIIKKNVFEKNARSHKDLTPGDSRNILQQALYNANLYGKNQKQTRPYNWILIHLADANSAIIVEVSDNKDNVEIVNWHFISDEAIERKKRQAIREGGLILTLESAAADTSDNSSSDGKGTTNSTTDNELGEKSAVSAQNRAESVSPTLSQPTDQVSNNSQQAEEKRDSRLTVEVLESWIENEHRQIELLQKELQQANGRKETQRINNFIDRHRRLIEQYEAKLKALKAEQQQRTDKLQANDKQVNDTTNGERISKLPKTDRAKAQRKALEDLGIFAEVELPKGAKWKDGKKFGQKGKKGYNSTLITALVVGVDLYVKGIELPWVNRNRKNHDVYVIRNFKQWQSVNDFKTELIDHADIFLTNAEEDAINEIFTEKGIGFNRRITRPIEKQQIEDRLDNTTEARQLATEAALTAIQNSGIEVVEATDEMVEEMLEEQGVEQISVSEAKRRADEIKALPPIEIEGNTKTKEELREDYENLPDVKKKGKIIQFYHSAFKKIYKQGGLFAQIIPQLDKILEQSVLAYLGKDNRGGVVRPDGTIHKTHQNVVSFDNFVSKVSIGGTEYFVRITVQQNKSGENGTHSFFVSNVELYKNPTESRTIPITSRGTTDFDRIIDAKLQKFFDYANGNVENAPQFLRTPSGTMYGWTVGGKIYLTPQGMNPSTPVHEYTHLWANAMMQKNPKGWKSVKDLLRGTPIWEEVMSDANYSDIRDNEDLVVSEVLSQLSGKENAKRLEAEAQRMLAEAKWATAKADAISLIEQMKHALQQFWNWVGTNLFGIDKFESMAQVTDRVLWDLMSGTDLQSRIRTTEIAEKMFVGEKGATALDKAQEATTRLDNLSIAREMENRFAEKKLRIEKLKASKPIEIQFNGEFDLNRGGAKQWLKNNIRGEYINNDTGEEIQVSKVGINEVTSHGERDEAHLKSLVGVPSIIENAVFIEEHPNIKGHDKYDSYRYYVCGLKINGIDYTAKVVIGVKGDNKYYDHRLTQIEKGTLINNLNGLSNSVAENQNTPHLGKDNRLISIMQINEQENARRIKFATGWERGGDGKWRYETNDYNNFDRKGELHKERYQLSPELENEYEDLEFEGITAWGIGIDKIDLNKEPQTTEVYIAGGMTPERAKRLVELQNIEKELKNEIRRLDDYIDAPDLFTAYPELRNVGVEIINDFNPTVLGAYNPIDNIITLYNGGTVSTLLHEIQHIIQEIEGFAKGGNTSNVVTLKDQFKADVAKLKELMDNTPKWREYNQALDRYFEDDTDTESADLAQSIYESGKLTEILNEQNRLRQKYGMNPIVGQIINEPPATDSEIWKKLPKSFSDKYESYHRLGGEVEARNVQSRISLTEDERRAKLAEETEDVARKDQIFITENASGFYKIRPKQDERQSNVEEDDVLLRSEETKNRIEDLFYQAILGEFKGKPVSVGRLTDEGKAYLEQISGVKFKDKVDFVLNPSDLVHIYKGHFGNNETDVRSIPLDIEDIRSIADVVSSPDRIIYSKENTGEKRKMFFFLKEAGNGAYNLLEIYADKKGNLTAKTFYKTKEGVSQRAITLSKSLHTTSETDGATLNNDAKIPQMFEPTSIEGEISTRQGEGDGAVSGSTSDSAMKRAKAEELSDRLSIDIELVEDGNTLSGKKARAKGFYDLRSGKITVVLSNNTSIADIEQTVLHEAVGHYGLRQLFGDHFDTFLDNVFQHAEPSIREKIARKASRLGWDMRKATEEYLAELAEDESIYDTAHSYRWMIKIKELFLDMLRSLGFIYIGPKLSDNELRYILWRSYENLQGRDRGIFGEAADIAMQQRMKVGEYAYRGESRAIDEINNRFNAELDRQIVGELPQGHIYELGMPGEVLLMAGLPNLPIEMTSTRLAEKSRQDNHPFALTEVKDLPRAIQEPMAVFRSATRVRSYVVLTEIEHNGKNYVVAIETNRSKGKIEINDVRSVYPKTNSSVVSWIEDGLLEYADKEKMSEWISKQRSNSAEVRNRFRHVAKVIKNFENPTIESKKNNLSDSLSLQSGLDEVSPDDALQFRDTDNPIEQLADMGYEVDPDKVQQALNGGWDFDYHINENATANDLTERLARDYMTLLKYKNGEIDLREAVRQMWGDLPTLSDEGAKYALDYHYDDKSRAISPITSESDKLLPEDKYLHEAGEDAPQAERETNAVADSQSSSSGANNKKKKRAVRPTTAYEREAVRDRYERRLRTSAYQSAEAMRDSMRSLHTAMKLIYKGKHDFIIEDVADYENAYLGENRYSSQSKAECDVVAKTLLPTFKNKKKRNKYTIKFGALD